MMYDEGRRSEARTDRVNAIHYFPECKEDEVFPVGVEGVGMQTRFIKDLKARNLLWHC